MTGPEAADAAPDVAAVRARLLAVQDRIAAAGRDPLEVTVVAVTKGFPPAVARIAAAAGLADLGENYAQELLAKVAPVEAVDDPPARPATDRLRDERDAPGSAGGPRWHFLGRLQTNKVRQLAGSVHLWQSVDRPDLVREIAKRAPGAGVLVQINLSGEATKGGCSWDDARLLVGLAGDEGLDVRGLMGVGPAGDPADSRPGFERLVALADALELPVRSIGMSADLEVAAAAGATMVRIGRDLFGPRPPRTAT